jgi:hypothetical protein
MHFLKHTLFFTPSYYPKFEMIWQIAGLASKKNLPLKNIFIAEGNLNALSTVGCFCAIKV